MPLNAVMVDFPAQWVLYRVVAFQLMYTLYHACMLLCVPVFHLPSFLLLYLPIHMVRVVSIVTQSCKHGHADVFHSTRGHLATPAFVVDSGMWQNPLYGNVLRIHTVSP